MTARSQKNKRCCKRQVLTSLLNCGNPNAYYRNVKFAVQLAKTTHQKNRCIAAFLFKFCFLSLYCSWCSCIRHHYCCNRCKFDYLANQIGSSGLPAAQVRPPPISLAARSRNSRAGRRLFAHRHSIDATSVFRQ